MYGLIKFFIEICKYYIDIKYKIIIQYQARTVN